MHRKTDTAASRWWIYLLPCWAGGFFVWRGNLGHVSYKEYQSLMACMVAISRTCVSYHGIMFFVWLEYLYHVFHMVGIFRQCFFYCGNIYALCFIWGGDLNCKVDIFWPHGSYCRNILASCFLWGKYVTICFVCVSMSPLWFVLYDYVSLLCGIAGKCSLSHVSYGWNIM